MLDLLLCLRQRRVHEISCPVRHHLIPRLVVLVVSVHCFDIHAQILIEMMGDLLWMLLVINSLSIFNLLFFQFILCLKWIFVGATSYQ